MICPPPLAEFYNSLEAPAFDKFPVLSLYQEFLRENGALVALMSGSGSTTFAIAENLAAAEKLAEKFKSQFGSNGWTAVVQVDRLNRWIVKSVQRLTNFASANSVISFAAGILNASAASQ